MRQVLLVCPQERDFREIAAAGLEAEFEILSAGSDLDANDPFDPERFVAEQSARDVAGAVGTKDRSALLAALIAERAGLPGPTPRALLCCQHKPTSRALQREAAPEFVPRFARLNGSASPLGFATPFFVKPVVGRLSENARRINSLAALAELAEDGYPPRYARIAALAGLPEEDVHGFLAEELLAGAEVTLEGYVHRGRVTTIGVTDSLKYPGTNSFEGFAFPSALPPDRLQELAGLAERVVPAHGFDDGFFNMELFVPATGPAKLIEVNGRIASQFASLVRAVQGRSTYEALLTLACGEDPAWQATAPRGVAISYCLRVFEDAFVAGVPGADEGVEILVEPGGNLSDQGTNDAESYRLAIFHEWGETREEALQRCRARAAALEFDLVPARALAAAARGDG